MTQRAALILAAGLAGMAQVCAAQQPAPAAPPPPSFAAPNLAGNGVRDLAVTCTICHGTGGKPAEGSAVAGLAGRPAADIVSAMKQFKDGQRPATIMHQIAKGYSDAEIAAMADYFSKQR